MGNDCEIKKDTRKGGVFYIMRNEGRIRLHFYYEGHRAVGEFHVYKWEGAVVLNIFDGG